MTVMTGFTADPGARRASAHKPFRLRPPYLLGGALLLLLAGGVYGIISIVLSPAPPKMKQVVHEISLLPPPPPPPVEQPPQPEIKEEVNIPEPQPAAQEDAPPGDLGVDGDANGSDNFQLRARKGGRDLLNAGGALAWYSDHIGESIDRVLYANKVRGVNYKKAVIIKLWLSRHDGSVERFELVGSTGNPELDRSIKLALAKIEPFGEPPPDLPQPVKLQTVLRQ